MRYLRKACIVVILPNSAHDVTVETNVGVAPEPGETGIFERTPGGDILRNLFTEDLNQVERFETIRDHKSWVEEATRSSNVQWRAIIRGASNTTIT